MTEADCSWQQVKNSKSDGIRMPPGAVAFAVLCLRLHLIYIFMMIVGYFAARVATGVAKTLREAVYDKILDFSMEEIGRFSTASLINRNTNDITQIQLPSSVRQAPAKAR